MIRVSKIISLFLVLALLCLSSPPPVHADGGAPNLAYVAGAGHGISIIDIGQQKVTGTLSVAGDPHSILLSLDGRFLYVTQPMLGRVAILSAKTGQTVCTASLPGQPSLLAIDTDTNVLFAAGNGATTVSALDPNNCAVKHTFETGSPVYGLAVALIGTGPAGGTDNQIWAAGTTAVTILDDFTGKQLASVPIPGGPQYVSIPTGIMAYVTTRSGVVDAIALDTRQVIPSLLTGGKFGPMDYDATTDEVYVPDQQHNQLDVLAPIISTSAKPPHEPERVFHLGVQPESIAITSDGQLGFIALAGGNVAMLDVPGHQIFNTVYVGGNPRFIITGLYPPALGTTPQQASTLNIIINIIAYALVIELILVPILLWRRYSRKQKTEQEKE